ncbi:glutamate--cysteine ligase regulatory subunit-like [Narcine bancroftii]|uniref:glutamate--cysteine ligase regulatory subunit-like n=1 Tax=Narcine bancroftii TaxID=1343680 RepID=UPI003831E5EC
MTELSSRIGDFSAVKSISVYTGNVVRWCNSAWCYRATPQQEILECIKAALIEWISKFIRDQVELNGSAEHVICNVIQDNERIGPNEREDIKLSAKLFLYMFEPGIISEAVTRACSMLGVAQLDSVTLALPPLPPGKHRSLEELLPLWEELETLVKGQKVTSIGVSDLDKKLLEDLCFNVQIQPSSCQVNLASCCIIPPELTTFASENNIQLLTHNDPTDIFPVGLFQETLGAILQDPATSECTPQWILRYSAIIKHRGVIKSKGYLIKAERTGENH